MDLSIGGGAYSVGAPIAVQTCVNLYPEVEKPGSQAQIVLRRFPGLRLLLAIGGKVRGIERMNGVLYGVVGDTLYSVSSSYAAVSLGSIPGTGMVSIAADGSNLVTVNGTDTSYVLNGSTLTTVTLPYASSKVLYLDTYFVHQRPDTNNFFISATASATTYSAVDIASKEGQHGNIISIFANHRDLILFGEETTETWRNTGNADFAFQRQEGTFQERGASGLFSPAEMDNSVYFLGDDRIVYTLNGYRPIRISHHAIETWLQKQTQAVIDAAYSTTATHEGHYWYILNFSTGTWVYDATVSNMLEGAEWFQLKSNEYDNWRIDTIQVAYGEIICGDGEGNLYALDKNTMTENGNTQIKERTTAYYINERKPLSCPRVELNVKRGVGNSDEANPIAYLEISKDDGYTWSSRRERSLGRAGEYQKVLAWRRNGRSRTWAFRWTVTDPVDVVFTGAYAEFSSGTG